MGIDYWICDGCEEPSPDCGYWTHCECGADYCEYDECGNKQLEKYKEVDSDEEHPRGLLECDICTLNKIEDRNLLKIILEKYGIDREEQEKEIRKKYTYNSKDHVLVRKERTDGIKITKRNDFGNTVTFESEGEEYFSEEQAIAQLTKDEVLFLNSRDYYMGWGSGNKKPEKPDGHTLVLFVNCNDIFAWACADGDDIDYDEIPELFKMHMKDRNWGSTKWCCKKRNEKPQKPVADKIKKDGCWENWMDDLKLNGYDEYLKKEKKL